MKWIWFLVLLLLITPVAGLKENFQTYDTSDFTLVQPGQVGKYTALVFYDADKGTIVLEINTGATSGAGSFTTNTPVTFTYAAWDSYGATYYTSIFDSLMAQMGADHTTTISTSPTRWEMKIVGGTPMFYKNGVYVDSQAVLSINPSFIRWLRPASSGGSSDTSNIIVGETDHHITRSLPSNWTIQRDLINPASTGIYAWSGTAWVLKNSYYFYVDADKEFLNPETLTIRHIGGTPINVTTGLTPVHNLLTYDLAQFLSTSTSIGTTPPDGLYSVSWDSMTPPNWFADTFWIISSGATVNWGQDTYAQSDVATITYAITTAYYDTTVYDYSLVVTDVYGTAKSTIAISSQTGTQSLTLTPATFADGVYYVQLKATKKSDSSVYVMNYDSMTVVGYVLFNGYVMNAENGTVLSDAYVNITQGSSNKGQFSIAGGLWNSTNNWLSGTPINLTTNKTGYTSDIIVFTPIAGRSISLNISLVPTVPSYTGIAIGGVVRDNVYYNPVVGATYHVKNGTEYTATTNIAGFARVDSLSLINNTLYDVWSSKTGFGNSSVAQKVAAGV